MLSRCFPKISIKRFILYFILFLLLSPKILSPRPVFAHPMDISYADVYVGKDVNDQPLPSDTLQVLVHLSWPEAALLFETSEVGQPKAEETLSTTLSSSSGTLDLSQIGLDAKLLTKKLANNQAILVDYFKENLLFYNNDKICGLKFKEIPELPEEEVLFGRGIQMNLEYFCPQPLEKITIIDEIFTDKFEAQINLVNIFSGPNKTLKGALLTPSSKDLTLDLTNQQISPESSKTVSLNQSSKFFDKIASIFVSKGKNSVLLAMFLVFLLGFLHTLEAGHSKTILASFLLNKEVSYKDGLLYVGVFTLTHIADIIILGIILLVTNSFVDVFSKLPFLQTFSLYALLFISIYMLFSNLAHLIQHQFGINQGHDHDEIGVLPNIEHHKESFSHKKQLVKNQLVLGFITGLAPCLMGWSIFMVILSTKKIWTLFPIILSFGLGIFVALALISLVVIRLKIKLFEKNRWIGEVSPLISSALLVIFALILILA